MNWQRGFCCVVVVSTLSFLSPSLFAQNCANNQAPIANAGPDRSGNVGVALNFTGSGTDSDGTITAYWFNFGDGSFASWQSSPLASHSFASAGTFSVRLWVKDNCGAMSASDTAIITITQAPANPCANNTAPIANAGPDRAGNPNVALLLTGYASTDTQNNISHYWWNFGDGQYTGWQTSAGVSHAFANTGTYSVRLWVKDSCGAMSGADTVIVNIVNPNPCAGNTPPNAVITSPSSGLVNQSLNFSGLSSSDSTGTIQSYLWNFGDGQTANGVNVSHSYASAGNKTVTLTLTDSCGAQGSMMRTIVISNPDPCSGNQPPVAQASANPASANINQSISFSAVGSSDPNGSITSYAWNFGDGSNGSGLSASHAYANAGSFNVALTVTDNCGATATKTISVSITNPNQGLQANFKMYKLTQVNAQNGQETWEEIQLPNPNHPIELGLKIKFDGSSSTGESYYVWEFMDDGSGGSTDPTTPYTIHQCNTAGSFPVHLTVYNADGSQSNTITKTIHVARAMEFLDALPLSLYESTGLAIDGNYGWTSHVTNMMKTLDLSDPANHQVMGTLQTPAGRAIAAGDGYVYLCTYGNVVYVYDQDELLANPNGTGSNPPQARIFNSGGCFSVVAARGLAFIAAESNGLRIIKPMPSGPPIEMGYFLLPAGRSARAIAVNEHTAYVSDNWGKVYGIDISEVNVLEAPVGPLDLVFDLTLGGPVKHISVSNSTAAFAYDNGVYLFQLSGALTEPILASYTELMNAYGGGTSPSGILAHQASLYVSFGAQAAFPGVSGIGIARFNITDLYLPYFMEGLGVQSSNVGGLLRNPSLVGDVIYWSNPNYTVTSIKVDEH